MPLILNCKKFYILVVQRGYIRLKRVKIPLFIFLLRIGHAWYCSSPDETFLSRPELSLPFGIHGYICVGEFQGAEQES